MRPPNCHDLIERMDLRTEKDLERVRAVALLQDAEIKRLTLVIATLSDRLAKAEGKDARQQALALIEAKRPQPEAAPPPPKPDKQEKRRKNFGANEQADLERQQVECTLPEDARSCPECGGQLVDAGLSDTSELIDVIELKYVVKQVSQRKYSCTGCQTLCRAPGPERAISGGRYGLDIGVKIAIDKYEHHIPLARQARIAAGHGLNISRNTLYNQIERLAEELEPAKDAVIAQILANPVIGLDQTGYLSRPGPTSTRKARSAGRSGV